MKKLYFLIALCVALSFTACESCSSDIPEASEGIVWNVKLQASGEGMLVASYPTGKLSLDGAANFAAESSNDTVEANLLGTPSYKDVLANQGNYDPETVNFAERVNSAIAVDTMSGKWNVDLTGYAKYHNIYLVIDEHWPADTTKIVNETDSI